MRVAALLLLVGLGCEVSRDAPQKAAPGPVPLKDPVRAQKAHKAHAQAEAKKAAQAKATADTKAGAAAPQLEPPKPVAKADAGVTVLEPGAKPHAELRYAPAAGAKHEFKLTIGLSLSMRMGPNDVPPTAIPPIIIDLLAVLGKPKAKSELRYTLTTKKVEAGEAPGVSDRVRKAVAKAVDQMMATKGELVLDSQGRYTSVDLSVPGNISADLQPAVDGFRQALHQLFVVLPREPVGVGARWRAVSHFKQGETPLQQTATYALASQRDGRMKITFDIQQGSLADAKAKLPQGEMTIDAHHASGSGSVEIDLNAFVPRTGAASSKAVTRSTVTLGGTAQPVMIGTDLSLRLDASFLE